MPRCFRGFDRRRHGLQQFVLFCRNWRGLRGHRGWICGRRNDHDQRGTASQQAGTCERRCHSSSECQRDAFIVRVNSCGTDERSKACAAGPTAVAGRSRYSFGTGFRSATGCAASFAGHREDRCRVEYSGACCGSCQEFRARAYSQERRRGAGEERTHHGRPGSRPEPRRFSFSGLEQGNSQTS